MRIAITTPTGNVGRKLTRILLDQGGHNLALLARDPSRLREEQADGAEILQGDLGDAAFVQKATRGADALFWAIPPHYGAPDHLEYQKGIVRSGVQAVRENGIKHVVFLSSIGGHLPSGTGPITGLHVAEEEFARIAAGLTILRPAFFMENFLATVETVRQANSIFLPVPPEREIPMIATRDIAAAAAAALTTQEISGKHIVPLHGFRDYSFAEVAQLLGKEMGAQINFVQVGAEQTKDAILKLGASDSVADTMLELYQAMANGRIRGEFPRSHESTTPTTFEEFARAILVPAVQATGATA
ncbi:NmrA family NAD(P)-binding protein [Candidatus Eisenbacteria bacterium]|uniref:NmrA family NAD(P)-binding protein n=1 Tax=Eiseniibacteriota bacterium TaxID=2212470 RepID=A0ABV6YJ86_UNCEI